MNGNSFLLDTNVVLYLLNGDEKLAEILYNRTLYISFISELELLSYQEISNKEQKQIEGFIEDCIVVDINSKIKKDVIKIRKQRKIKLPDSIILATSNYLNIPLVSSDSDFSNIEDANLIYYRKD